MAVQTVREVMTANPGIAGLAIAPQRSAKRRSALPSGKTRGVSLQPGRLVPGHLLDSAHEIMLEAGHILAGASQVAIRDNPDDFPPIVYHEHPADVVVIHRLRTIME